MDASHPAADEIARRMAGTGRNAGEVMLMAAPVRLEIITRAPARILRRGIPSSTAGDLMTSNPAGPPDPPKILVDSDWKAEAQREKERLAAAEAARTKQKPTREGTAQGELPEPTLAALVEMLASQAVMGLGALVDRETRGLLIDLEGARFAIDLLGMLEEKTKGNLDANEATQLRQVLAELRARYVQVSQLIAKEAAAVNIRRPASELGSTAFGGPARSPSA
jgi:hypothetical protein